ncbi:radical SAM protein [bacterium (candidate division B38) B3_B38]|nr:MAG: radical SAM protein [bacterium (candidate division B38) B3_B38]
MKHIYGPVSSRRLGLSLGVDLVPFKTCNFDCIYCQLGRTTRKTEERREWVSIEEVIEELKATLSHEHKIDCLTFSGSGEPSLNSRLGEAIREIKRLTTIPVAVLTNGSLLRSAEMREKLMESDLVVPSLDAASQRVFEKVNRPLPPLKIEEVIEGLRAFKKAYRGKLWLEIMLVKGVNDSPDELQMLKETISRIAPHKVQLNTVVRPPSEPFALPITREEMDKVKVFLGSQCEVIARFSPRESSPLEHQQERAIWESIQRRPATIKDLADGLGLHPNETLKYIKKLIDANKIEAISFGVNRYYKPIKKKER